MSELYISRRDMKSLLQNIASKLRNPLKDEKLDETVESFQKNTNSYKGINIKKVLVFSTLKYISGSYKTTLSR